MTTMESEGERRARARVLNAERQRRYRERNRKASARGAGAVPVSLVISTAADFQIDMLATHIGCTRRALVEALVDAKYADVIERLPADEFDELSRRCKRKGRSVTP